jgi:hypothetical protein
MSTLKNLSVLPTFENSIESSDGGWDYLIPRVISYIKESRYPSVLNNSPPITCIV